jgi:hypothetical protein
VSPEEFNQLLIDKHEKLRTERWSTIRGRSFLLAGLRMAIQLHEAYVLEVNTDRRRSDSFEEEEDL